MNRSPFEVIVLAAPALVAGIAAVAVASAVDPLALRLALQAVALVAVAAMLWRAAAGAEGESGRSDIAPLPRSAAAALGSDRRLATFDRDTGLCVAWYFRLRAEEEIGRATRYGQPFTVVTMTAGPSESLEGARFALKQLLRQVDFGGDLGNKLAAVLPQTERAGALVVADRLRDVVPDAVIRVAQYPVDGATLSHLLGDDEWRTGPISSHVA
jgi:GGDEF domain-containing protein